MMPLRFRIALLSALVSGVVLVAFAGTFWVVIERQKVEAIDAQIRSLGLRMPGWMTQGGGLQRMGESLVYVFGEGGAGRAPVAAVGDGAGSVLHVSPDWPEAIDPRAFFKRLPEGAEEGMDAERAGAGERRGGGRGAQSMAMITGPTVFETVDAGEDGVWRIGVLGGRGRVLVIGIDLAGVRSEMAELRRVLLWVIPAAGVLILAGGWMVAARALRPIGEMAERAAGISERDLSVRLDPAPGSPEINGLIEVLNQMMERLERGFHQAARFSADSSHELKTPLAVMQGEIEQALRIAADDSAQQVLCLRLLEQVQRLKTITRGLLMLARADAGALPLASERFNIAALVLDAVEDARLLGGDSGLEFRVDVADEVMIEGDRSLLQTAVLNLLVNAVKYNKPGGRVDVGLRQDEGVARLSVGNEGPGIADEERERVFERFFRGGDGGRQSPGGLGLGLSLAREIARAHGGDVATGRSREGWTEFILTLPGAR